MASYLTISAVFDDFVPEVNSTVPRKLTHFIEEVTDGTVTDASLKFAKDWLDSTGQCPHYINPVHAVMSSKYNLSLDSNSTYRWRTKLTASASDRNRLCASYDGKNKTSRLKTMLPSVARFILAQGPVNMWAELVAAREADKQSSDRSPTKAVVKRKLTEVFFFFLTDRSVDKSVALPITHPHINISHQATASVAEQEKVIKRLSISAEKSNTKS